MSGPRPNRFVGRRRELAELRGWLADAQAGRGRLVVIRGEAGVGKTRLAEELGAAAAAMAMPVVWSRCSADAAAPPLWPLRRVVNLLPGEHARLPAVDGFGSSSEGSVAARFAQAVWFADTVVEAARPAGLLVVVEDLHWADSGTEAALGQLAAELPRSRGLVVATARLRSDSDAVTALLDRPGVEQRQLPGLDRDEIADYLSAVAGGSADGRYADFVLRQTAGNSLFVGAVTRLLVERVSLRSYDAEGSRAALAGRPELVDLVREPMRRVSADCRDLVEIASVGGGTSAQPNSLRAAIGQSSPSWRWWMRGSRRDCSPGHPTQPARPASSMPWFAARPTRTSSLRRAPACTGRWRRQSWRPIPNPSASARLRVISLVGPPHRPNTCTPRPGHDGPGRQPWPTSPMPRRPVSSEAGCTA